MVSIWGHEGRGTMGDIIGLPSTICWPLEHIYTQEEVNLEFGDFSHFWSQMTVYDGPCGDYMGS